MFDNKFNQYRTEVCPEIQISIMKIIYKICISVTNLVYIFSNYFYKYDYFIKKIIKTQRFSKY